MAIASKDSGADGDIDEDAVNDEPAKEQSIGQLNNVNIDGTSKPQ